MVKICSYQLSMGARVVDEGQWRVAVEEAASEDKNRWIVSVCAADVATRD